MEAGGNQVSFRKQDLSLINQSRLDDDVHQKHERLRDEITTNHTRLVKSPPDSNHRNLASTSKAQALNQALVRLGIRDEADLIQSNIDCVKMLIITDYIIIVCYYRRLMVSK